MTASEMLTVDFNVAALAERALARRPVPLHRREATSRNHCYTLVPEPIRLGLAWAGQATSAPVNCAPPSPDRDAGMLYGAMHGKIT
jgi:hypothetical protein